jgi:hypothetical protein
MELLKNLEGMSADEQMSAVVELQKAAMKNLEEQKQVSIGKSAEMVIQGLKKIKADFEAKFDSLNYDIQTKVANLKDGQQGIQGQKGEQGDRGLDGAQGRDGKSGSNGKDGLDGKDGISVQDAKIDFDGSLVITLSDGREINVGEVVPVDVAQTIHKIQSGSGGDSQTTLNAIAALQATIATYGTMALQNANAVAITGGTINGTTVGATTPAAGTFTTLTAQTEVLKGTGNNLFFFSQDLSNASYWNKANSSISGTLFTAPDATTTANSLIESSATGLHYVQQFSPTLVSGNTYTISVYLKAGTRTWGYIGLPSGVFGATSAYFNLSTGAVGTVVGGTAAITSVGSGWYRCSITKAATAGAGGNILIATATADNTVSYTGDGTSNILVWGAQLEIGTSAFTYIPTTTTAVYGTPTLSFSGVSTIGLESNGSLFVQPAGTGALQAQATTSSAVGGNARGANAVDWQTARGAAGSVASSPYSVVGGGNSNAVSGNGSYGGTLSGVSNNTTGFASVISGGWSNSATGGQAAVVGGYSNSATGVFNFIGGGTLNSGTANAAVTTQSATMNGTTAVTLSASNANIKVGQYITGTSISFNTYVAAISGTSLTLSQAAGGSSTSTLSFFTPYSAVVGGGNNTATGSYSFIGGGGDAGTAGNRNVASGDWSTVGGGAKNTASGNGSVVAGGGTNGSSYFANTASGAVSFIGSGWNNTSSGSFSFVGSGDGNTTSGSYSSITSGRFGTTRSITGNQVFPACSAPISTGNGASQAALLLLGRQTTDATATVITSDGSAASTTNQVILPNNSAYFFTGEVVSGVTGGGNTKGWTIEGVIKRGANAASTALIGTPTVTSTYADAGASTWVIAVTADTTNGGLAVTFTGQASTTIRTVAQIRTTEMTY